MRIAYLTTDDVNAALAAQLAADCGLSLCQLAPQGAAPDGEFDAAVYDLDFLPAGRLGRLLADLAPGGCPTRWRCTATTWARTRPGPWTAWACSSTAAWRRRCSSSCWRPPAGGPPGWRRRVTGPGRPRPTALPRAAG
jgi:hypothetical protein